MNASPALPHVLPPRVLAENAEPSRSPDLAIARYVDRELANARATAELCTSVSARARAEGRVLVANVLHDFAAEFTGEVASLALAARPDVRWPGQSAWPVRAADLDESIDAIGDSLQHSERTLRWIARRPDLAPSAVVAFDALASARNARRRLLRVCNEIDRL